MKRFLLVVSAALVGVVLASGATAQQGEPASSATATSAASTSPAIDASATAPAASSAPPAAASATPSGDKPPPNQLVLAGGVQTPMLRYANTWDLNIDFGYGDAFGDVRKGNALVRGRLGGLFIRDNSFWQIGAFGEWSTAARTAFGVQGEYLHLEAGMWMQLGGMLDLKGRPGGMAAVGLSLFGVEAQVRQLEGLEDPAFVLLGKVRIPIGILVYAFTTRH